jgi:tetratricopeptide (TPR) repeat protein
MSVTPQIIEANIAAGNYKVAENLVNEALKEHPDSARAHLLKAEVLVKEGNLQESQQEYAKVVGLDKTGDTVNSPMYHSIQQEYVVLNSHQEASGMSWEVIVLILMIIFAGAWLVIRKHLEAEKKAQADREKAWADLRAAREADLARSANSSRSRKLLQEAQAEKVSSVPVSTYAANTDPSRPVMPPVTAAPSIVPLAAPPAATPSSGAQTVYVPTPTPVIVNTSSNNTTLDTMVGVMAAEAIMDSGHSRRRREEESYSSRSTTAYDPTPTYIPAAPTPSRSVSKSDWDDDSSSSSSSSGSSSSRSSSWDDDSSSRSSSSSSGSSSWGSSSSYSSSSSSDSGSSWSSSSSDYSSSSSSSSDW